MEFFHPQIKTTKTLPATGEPGSSGAASLYDHKINSDWRSWEQMAACLRRAVSSRSALLQRYIVSLQSRGPVSSAISSPLTSADDLRPIASSLPYLNICYRGFAKSKKSNDHSGGGSIDMAVDIGPGLKEGAEAQMDAAIIALSRDLAKLRSGRASAGMLDHIIVEVDGVKMPLIRLAVVSVLDPRTLSVNPYDPNTLKTLESAIVSSPLGLNPKLDGQRLIAAIPPLTKEHMQAMCKVVTKSCEDVKQSIRRARQKALDTVKKASSGLSKDHVKKLEKEIDDLTKKFIKSAEDMCRAKEKEITSG